MKVFGILLCTIIATIIGCLMDRFASIGNEASDMMVKNIAFTLNLTLFILGLGTIILISYVTGIVRVITDALDKWDSGL